MRRTASAVAIVITSVLSMTTAYATPPTGDVKFKDMTRAQAAEAATVAFNTGNTFASGSYSIAPAGETGWRQLSGTAALGVNKGKLVLVGGEGCATKEYGAGKAAVVPPGTYLVRNPGSEPLEFFGFFLNQAPGAPKPLAEGPTEAAPANCTGVVSATAAPSGVSLADAALGTLVPGQFGYGNATLDITAGKDVYASWLEIAPGWSSGWLSHHPAANIVSTGTLSYVEARDGKCDESEEYSAGEAFYHPAHRHMAFNKGKEKVILWTMYFNLPHDDQPLPVIGNTITAVDFTQLPPAECPRLR